MKIEEIDTKTHFQGEWERQLAIMGLLLEDSVDKYKLLDDAYRASGGFEDGSYLIPHPSEGMPKYIRRKKMAYYINYVKPIVDALVNPIFKSEPVRDGISNLYNLFMEDVDGNNTTLTRFMKKAAIRAKLHGVEFIVVDMATIGEEEIITEKQIIEERIYPYLYLVSPAQITDYALDKFGRLVYIAYKVTNYTIDDEGNKKTINEIWKWTNTKCKRSIDGVEEVFENPIGMIPIVPLYGAINNDTDLLVQSDVFAMAEAEIALFNACSELRERNSQQAFSLLTFPIAEDDDYSNAEEGIRVGTADMLLYRGESSNKPEFITPPPDSSDMLLNEIEFIVKEIYRMASLRMSTDKNTYNVSAIARKIENQQYYQSVAELAQGLEEAEYRLNKIFNLYMGDNSEGFSVTYNREYAVLDVQDILNEAVTSLALGMTTEYNKEMRKQVARAVFADVGKNILDPILESIENDTSAGESLSEESEPTTVQPTRS